MMGKLLEKPPPELMQKLASAMSNAATQMSTQAPQMQASPSGVATVGGIK